MILSSNYLTPIEILLQLIVDRYLLTSYCVTIISENPMQIISKFSYRNILVDRNDSLTDLVMDASESGCSDYIVRIQEPEKFFIALDYVAHHGLIRRSDRKIIILPISGSNETLLNTLKMREVSYVLHVLLVVPVKEEENYEVYDLVTHKFVGTNNTDSPIYLDRWNSSSQLFERDASLFPHDLSNLEGKRVKVACFTYTPYVLLDIDTSIVPSGWDGVEVRLMKELCKWINCTIEVVPKTDKEWGAVYENFTGIGVLGCVVEDCADFGITALYSWYEEFLYMDFSTYVVRTAVTCIAPSPRLLASWAMPLLPFKIYMWIGLVFTFIYESTALWIAQGFSFHRIFFTTFGILTTQSQPDAGFKSWRLRSVLGWMMLTGLVLDNAYGGGLASTFTVPRYEPSVDTIKDMVDRNLIWIATHDAWVFSLRASQDPLIKQLVSQFETYDTEELERLSYTRSVGFGVERLPAGYFAIGEYVTDKAVKEYTILLENFYYELSVVMMRKSSPYTLKINKLIGRLHESGLMLAWETQIALRLLNYKVQIHVKLSRSQHATEIIEPLNFRHVIGVFILYGIGVTLALIAFLAEILWVRLNQKPNSTSTSRRFLH